MSDVKKGSLVGWKYRAALVMGKVIDIQGQKLILAPISKPDSRVTRQRVKVILESELDRADVEEALSHGGHTARAKLHTSSPKAQAMGLTTPHQLMPNEDDARKAKKERNKAYEEEAAQRERVDTETQAAGSQRSSKRQKKQLEEPAVGGAAKESEAVTPPPTPKKHKGSAKRK